MKDVLGYELAGVPPSMFDETGEMRKSLNLNLP